MSISNFNTFQKLAAWHIPAIETLEIQERRGPSKVPTDFDLLPMMIEAPKPAPSNLGSMVSFFDFTDRLVIESLDTHAEEVSLTFGEIRHASLKLFLNKFEKKMLQFIYSYKKLII